MKKVYLLATLAIAAVVLFAGCTKYDSSPLGTTPIVPVNGASKLALMAGTTMPAPIVLGLAGNFAILSKTGITTTGVTSVIGNIGVSLINTESMTGF